MSVQLYFVQLKFCLIYTKLYSFMSGTFELHITDGNTLRSLSTLCRTFLLSGIKHYQIAIECENVIRGHTIVVKKMDGGSLRLY